MKNFTRKKNKILFVMHMPPPIHGAAMMGKYIHDSKYINETFECRYINLSTANDLTDIGKIRLKKFSQFYLLLKKIQNEIKFFEPQIVYVTPNARGGAFYKDFIVIQMLKKLGCKVIIHYHNKGVSTRQNRIIDNFLYKVFFKNIKVILLAESLYQDIKKYVSRQNVFICPNGIPEIFNHDYSNSHQNDIPKLLFLSNMLIEKGVITLLDACKILNDRGYKFTCDFIGGETSDINTEYFNQEISKRQLNSIVKYKGKKYGIEKEEILERSNLFIFPTYYSNECFPLVLLEAMQHGLPCISTNEGGITDIIINNETGYIVEKKSAQELADKIEILLKNRHKMKTMGINSFKRYSQLYTLKAFEQRISSILVTAISQ